MNGDANAKAYDLNPLNSASSSPNYQNHSPSAPDSIGADWIEKQGKTKKRWDAVLDRKNTVIESKQAHLHDLLMKKFKKEKKMKERLEDAQADQMWNNERKAEKLQIAK